MTVTDPGAAHRGGFAGLMKRGATMSAIGLVICQVITVAQTIALGRLLGPEEIGAFAAGTVTMGLLLVAHSSLSQALVQREHDLEDAANTVLVVTFVTGLVLALAVLAASPLIGHLFHDTRVGLIAAASSGLVLLHCCSSVPDALMQRAFQFKRRLIVAPAISLVFATVSVLFAILGYGAWAMVIGTYMSMFVGAVLNWWMVDWRPFRGHFSFKSWRELAGFSFALTLDGIAERARDMTEQALVGRSLGIADLGQYRYAYRIASMPSLAVVDICRYVLFPAFARIRDNTPRFREAFLRALGWISFAAFPIAAMSIVAGPPIVVLLLGEEWRAAGAATAAMAGLGLGSALGALGWEAIKGAGRTSLLNWLTALLLVLGLGLFVLALPFGLVGVGIAISVAYLIIGCVTVEFARSVIGVSFRETAACLAPPAVSASVAFAVVFPLERIIVRSDNFSELAGLASVVAECALFGLVYLGVLRVASPNRFLSVKRVVERAVSRLGGLGRRSA